MTTRVIAVVVLALSFIAGLAPRLKRARPTEHVAALQARAIEFGYAEWGYWGSNPRRYSGWKQHSNRLIPTYVFGATLQQFKNENSPYRDETRIRQLYDRVPSGTHNTSARYFDQTDVYRLQKAAVEAGKKHVVLFIFDGLDWHTTRAAAVYRSRNVNYTSGPGMGLSFQDYKRSIHDYGYFVTSPHNSGTHVDVDAQVAIGVGGTIGGGYDARLGGEAPWERPADREYLLGKSRAQPHVYTDSAAAATSMTCGVKTYNGAINVSAEGQQVIPLARFLQREYGFAIGVVTNVPISHATPASAYANNVSRHDYQDLFRDLVGLQSVSHRTEALRGVDVLIGAGWDERRDRDDQQGLNFQRGLRYVTQSAMNAIRLANGGSYRIVTRSSGVNGANALATAAATAARDGTRLLGFFGIAGGHLPYPTADGGYDPVHGAGEPERYTQADITENPTLADMTRAALSVLSQRKNGFWLMIEAGDVDWASHDNNIDNTIGAILAGDEAFRVVTEWVEAADSWDDTLVIVTADHGHSFVLTDPHALVPESASQNESDQVN